MNTHMYRKGVEWIANNDNPGDDEGVEATAGTMTVLLLADLLDIDNKRVARAVVRRRRQLLGEITQ